MKELHGLNLRFLVVVVVVVVVVLYRALSGRLLHVLLMIMF